MSSEERASGAKTGGKPAMVPKLRFPEFRKLSGWEPELIGSYLQDCTGRVPSDTDLPVYSSTREGLKRQDAYFDGNILENKNDYGTVPPGCFVYRHMSDDGLFKFNINDTGGEIAVSKEYPVFRAEGLNSIFLLAKLNDGLDFKQFALSQKAGGTRTRLYFSKLCEWRTLLPTHAEQKKIAECLSSLDEAIAVQASKVEALKKHKRGLMQQLFPREGETQPRLRFPEFQKASEWKSRTLDSVCRSFSGGTPSTSKPEYYGGDIPFIRSAEIARDKTELFLTRKGLENSAAKLVAKGDVLVALYGANSGDVALATIGGAINQAILCLKSKESNSFICQFLNFKKDWIVATYLQGGQGNLSGEIIKSIVVSFPAPEEQKRIAACLSSLDALITTEAKKLETLKTHKRGLTQQLFPSRAEDNA